MKADDIDMKSKTRSVVNKASSVEPKNRQNKISDSNTKTLSEDDQKIIDEALQEVDGKFTKEEEEQYWDAARHHKDIKAAEAIILGFQKLVEILSKKFYAKHKNTGIECADTISVGNLALIETVRGIGNKDSDIESYFGSHLNTDFDPDKGRLSNYLSWAIIRRLHEYKDTYRGNSPYYQGESDTIDNFVVNFTKENYSPPDDKTIKESLGYSDKKFDKINKRRMAFSRKMQSWDEFFVTESNKNKTKFVNNTTPEDILCREESCNEVAVMFFSPLLSDLDRKIAYLYFVEKKKKSDIGRELNVTRYIIYNSLGKTEPIFKKYLEGLSDDIEF